MAAGTRMCGDSLDAAAAETAVYMRKLTNRYPNTQIGDIEPYTFNSEQLIRWVTSLGHHGVRPAQLHLDVNVHYLDCTPANTGTSRSRDA